MIDKANGLSQLEEMLNAHIELLAARLGRVAAQAEAASEWSQALENELSLHEDLFDIFRGNLLVDLIKKQLPEEASNLLNGRILLKNYKEANFKKATKNFDVSKHSAQVMEALENFQMVSLLKYPDIFAEKSVNH